MTTNQQQQPASGATGHLLVAAAEEADRNRAFRNAMWQIQATTVRDGVMRQVPTFYLNAGVQGIAHGWQAVIVALDIITSDRAIEFSDVAVTASNPFTKSFASEVTSGPETFKAYMTRDSQALATIGVFSV
jgi:hypothetical protein